MYTQCPHCRTLFQITASQLTVAQGRVRCSHCDQAFNALHTLLDDLPDSMRQLLPDAAAGASPAARSVGGDADADLADAQPETARAHEVDAPSSGSNAQVATETGVPASADMAVVQAAVGEADTQSDSGSTPDPDGDTDADTDAAAAEDDPDEPRFSISDVDDIHWEPPAMSSRGARLSGADEDDAPPTPDEDPNLHENEAEPPQVVPPEEGRAEASGKARSEPRMPVDLDEDQVGYAGLKPEPESGPAPTVRSWLQPVYGLVALLLVVLLPLQYAYFMRADLAGYAALRPWLERMCQYARCDLPLQRDPAAIELVNRSVVSHPSVRKALLITAAFKNTADFIQAYPVLEVTLTDATGGRVAMRRFLPREYLAAGSDPAQGIGPGALVNVVLEVAEVEQVATSYQFEFL